MARVLITGGTGFAGSHLIEALTEQGYDDIHTTSHGSVVPEIMAFLPEDHFHKVDLTDAEATAQLIEQLQPDHIYHLAAFAFVGKSFEKAPDVFRNNVTLQINVLEAVRQFAPEARVLIVGSAEEYGISESEDELPIDENHALRPVNPYAVSKITQDLLGYAYAHSFKLNVLRVRPFNHIGERQSEDFVVPAFISQIVKIENGEQEALRVGTLETERDFTDVKDVVRAYITVMEKGDPKEVYNIGSGQAISMKALLDMMLSMSETEVRIEEDPDRMRPSDIPIMVADNTKIKTLGWEPQITLEETIKRIFNWYRKGL